MGGTLARGGKGAPPVSEVNRGDRKGERRKEERGARRATSDDAPPDPESEASGAAGPAMEGRSEKREGGNQSAGQEAAQPLRKQIAASAMNDVVGPIDHDLSLILPILPTLALCLNTVVKNT